MKKRKPHSSKPEVYYKTVTVVCEPKGTLTSEDILLLDICESEAYQKAFAEHMKREDEFILRSMGIPEDQIKRGLRR